MLRAFLVDDEELALRRLGRMLDDTGRIQVVGSASDPVDAVDQLRDATIDVLFLDIHMPTLTGFDVLARLDPQPVVVFTTAHQEYALRAFEVNSIDYLLKPVEEAALDRALQKLERLRGQPVAAPLPDLLAQVKAALQPRYPERIASRTGERIEFIDLAHISHFYAKDKLTFAATAAKHYVVDQTIQELEEKLDPQRFVRIHRSTIVQVAFVQELHQWFAGRLVLKLKDAAKTELTVARDRVKELKEKLGV